MGIHPNELKWYKSSVVSSGNDNGDVISENRVYPDEFNNIFLDISDTEVAAETAMKRKVFAYLENDENLTLTDPYIFISNPTSGLDSIYLTAATETDTQGDLTGTEQQYGIMKLSSAATEGDSIIYGTIEVADAEWFTTGDSVLLIGDTYEEMHHNVTVSIVGTAVTITLDTDDTLHHPYTTDMYVAALLQVGDFAPDFTVTENTSSAGTFDGSEVELNNLGSADATWTITVGLDNFFTCVSPTEGSFYGYLTSDFAPQNPNKGNRPYFIIRASTWAGTWLNSDTLSFSTDTPSNPVWLHRDVISTAPATIESVFDIGVIGY